MLSLDWALEFGILTGSKRASLYEAYALASKATLLSNSPALFSKFNAILNFTVDLQFLPITQVLGARLNLSSDMWIC